jgi:hypothetical protein
MSKIDDPKEPPKKEEFKATHIPFDEGVKRVNNALSEVGHKLGSRIFTSRDTDVVKLCNLLAIDDGLPKGMTKWQLPFYLERGQFFMTTGRAGVKVGEHSHDEDGVRFIISGSIVYDGIELSAGDWMFLPKDERYSFKVGIHGVTMGYCYACCCVPTIELSRQETINPADYVRVRKSLSK